MLSGFRNEQPNISIKKVYLTFYILKSLIEYFKKTRVLLIMNLNYQSLK